MRLGEFVEFLGHLGVLGLGAGHLLGDANDVDSGSDDGAKVSNLVAYPRGGGDCDDVDLVGVEDGGGIGRDMDSEGIDAEHLADIFTVQGRIDVDGPDKIQSILGRDEFGHSLAHGSQAPLDDSDGIGGGHCGSS